MCTEDFEKMLILDGSFIVELFIKRKEIFLNEIPIKFLHNALNSLNRDLVLFENQIPFFILETIYCCCYQTSNDKNIIKLALDFLHLHEISWEMLSEEYFRKNNIDTVRHLLDLFHVCFVILAKPIGKGKNSTHQRYRTSMITSTASELKEHGIQFRKKGVNSSISYDISFKNGIIEIPHVNIADRTSSVYRNLLALEQSCRCHGNKFTSYVVFMDDLIDTADDVTLLTKNKILDNNIGSVEEVAKLVNEICIGLSHNKNHHYLVEVYNEINSYCGRPINKWWAKLMHNYFDSPWTIISLFGVCVLLTFTIIQTVYSIKSFNNEN
ncbi:hypothetical protein ZOSMA_305G00150 [Zostera marina]|nr:hypothetical protein ZOSMA_305G00150 [Zostera marina]